MDDRWIQCARFIQFRVTRAVTARLLGRRVIRALLRHRAFFPDAGTALRRRFSVKGVATWPDGQVTSARCVDTRSLTLR